MYCWLFRLMISHAMDGDKQLSKRTTRHLRHCASCRQFYKTCLSLGEGLRHQTATSSREAPGHLSERIFAAIHTQQPKTYKVGMKLGPAVAAACVGLVAVTGVLLLFREPKKRQPNEYDKAVQVARNVAVSVQNLTGNRLTTAQFPQGWPGLVEEPLASEIRNLTNDTQSAVRFLVDCMSVGIIDTKTKLGENHLL